MTDTTTIVVSFVHITCGECGVLFGMTREFVDQRKSDHETVYCPNGHSLWYPGDTQERKEERLKKQVANLQELNSARYQELLAERRRAAAARGVATRMRNRVKNGVCPCCNRTFRNLLDHMKTKHPDWRASE